jgi:transcriptional regulator with XRE-family HTH domain
MADDHRLADKLRLARNKAGLSQQELADAANVSRPTIANIERGAAKNVTLEILRRLASALKVDTSDLIASETRDGKAFVESFLASDWAKVAKPTPDEIAWLRSLSEITWMGGTPTDETFYLMLDALRKRQKGNQ